MSLVKKALWLWALVWGITLLLKNKDKVTQKMKEGMEKVKSVVDNCKNKCKDWTCCDKKEEVEKSELDNLMKEGKKILKDLGDKGKPVFKKFLWKVEEFVENIKKETK